MLSNCAGGSAGVFVSIAGDGSLSVDRGYVRPEDEPSEEDDGDETGNATMADPASQGAIISVGGQEFDTSFGYHLIVPKNTLLS